MSSTKDELMTKKEGFEAMLYCLKTYWENKESEEEENVCTCQFFPNPCYNVLTIENNSKIPRIIKIYEANNLKCKYKLLVK